MTSSLLSVFNKQSKEDRGPQELCCTLGALLSSQVCNLYLPPFCPQQRGCPCQQAHPLPHFHASLLLRGSQAFLSWCLMTSVPWLGWPKRSFGFFVPSHEIPRWAFWPPQYSLCKSVLATFAYFGFSPTVYSFPFKLHLQNVPRHHPSGPHLNSSPLWKLFSIHNLPFLHSRGTFNKLFTSRVDTCLCDVTTQFINTLGRAGRCLGKGPCTYYMSCLCSKHSFLQTVNAALMCVKSGGKTEFP